MWGHFRAGLLAAICAAVCVADNPGAFAGVLNKDARFSSSFTGSGFNPLIPQSYTLDQETTVPVPEQDNFFFEAHGKIKNNYATPSVSVSADWARFPADGAIATSYNVFTELDYFIEFHGPTEFVDATVQSNGSVTVKNNAGGRGSAVFELTSFVPGATVNGQSEQHFSACLGSTPLTCGSDPQSFEANAIMTVKTAVIYEVILQVGVGGAFEHAEAFVDPQFSVPVGYSFDISGGIGNSLSETPLPATLPLFAAGLGALGVLARRRTKRAVLG